MEQQDYLTVLTPFETELEIKKSRFIGRVYPIQDLSLIHI